MGRVVCVSVKLIRVFNLKYSGDFERGGVAVIAASLLDLPSGEVNTS